MKDNTDILKENTDILPLRNNPHLWNVWLENGNARLTAHPSICIAVRHPINPLSQRSINVFKNMNV